MKKFLLALIGIAALLGFDLWTKQIFFISPLDEPHFSFFYGWIQQIDHHNFGITANLPIPQPLIIVVTIIALGYFFTQLLKTNQLRQIAQIPEEDYLSPPAMFLVILVAGALGNLFDRVTLGYVRDWILLFNRSAINTADIMIAIGLVGWILSKRKPTPETSEA